MVLRFARVQDDLGKCHSDYYVTNSEFRKPAARLATILQRPEDLWLPAHPTIELLLRRSGRKWPSTPTKSSWCVRSHPEDKSPSHCVRLTRRRATACSASPRTRRARAPLAGTDLSHPVPCACATALADDVRGHWAAVGDSTREPGHAR